MKDLKFVIVIVCIYFISIYLAYFLGAKFGSKETIVYKDRPIFKTDTLTIYKEKITYANVSKDNPPIISDSLPLDEYFKNMFVKYVARPYYRDSLLQYNTEWKHNITVIKELTIDTFKIKEIKKDWNFSCLTGSIGFVGGVVLSLGTIFYILLK